MGPNKRDQATSRAQTGGDHGGSIAPEDSFLIQIRGSSRPAESAISGRVEHLHSGSSEQFGSLAGLLDFLSRHVGRAVVAAQLEFRPNGGNRQ